MKTTDCTPLTVVMLSVHTSPLAQPGQGDAGGMNVYVHQSAQALARMGHQVLMLSRDDGTSYPNTPDQKLPGLEHASVIAGPRSVIAKEDLPQYLDDFVTGAQQVVVRRAKHPIVLHGHYWLSGVVGVKLKQLLAAPLVQTMHTIAAVKNAHDSSATEPVQRLKAEDKIMRLADHMIANSETEKTEILKFSQAQQNRVTVLPPGVDHEVFSPDGTRSWPGHEANGALKVLFAGRLQHHKGAHVLVDALDVLKQSGFAPLPKVHFVGARSGSSPYDVMELAKKRGLASQFSVSDAVEASTLAQYFRGADVVAMPSLSESFGLVALEAQATGTPVIAHRVGGLKYAVQHEVSGLLVDSLAPDNWAEALADVTQMAAQPNWETWRAAAVEHARQFDWNTMAQKLTGVYSPTIRASK